MEHTKKRQTLYILDSAAAIQVTDMLYKVIDTYWQLLHDRQIDLPGKADCEEVELFKLLASLKSNDTEDSHF